MFWDTQGKTVGEVFCHRLLRCIFLHSFFNVLAFNLSNHGLLKLSRNGSKPNSMPGRKNSSCDWFYKEGGDIPIYRIGGN